MTLTVSPAAFGQQPAAGGGPNAAVPVKKIILYSSGVGYFQHAGSVNGDATTDLQFDTGQINDVLKSLILEDKGGSVSSVTYASQNPLARTLKSFHVDITGNPTLDQLLNQLRGEKVTATLPAEQISGTILGVETRTQARRRRKNLRSFGPESRHWREHPLCRDSRHPLISSSMIRSFKGELAQQPLAAVAGARGSGQENHDRPFPTARAIIRFLWATSSKLRSGRQAIALVLQNLAGGATRTFRHQFSGMGHRRKPDRQ